MADEDGDDEKQLDLIRHYTDSVYVHEMWIWYDVKMEVM